MVDCFHRRACRVYNPAWGCVKNIIMLVHVHGACTYGLRRSVYAGGLHGGGAEAQGNAVHAGRVPPRPQVGKHSAGWQSCTPREDL
jgi:hypothetical protein